MLPRMLVITRTLAGRTVLDLLRGHFRLTPSDVKHLLKNRGIKLSGHTCQDRDLPRRVRAGERLAINDSQSKIPDRKRARNSVSEKESATKIPIVYIDDDIIVANKPAGLTTVRHATDRAKYGQRGQKFLPATLVDLLARQLAGKAPGGRPRAVHRLDKETSGLIVLARTPEAESELGLQFRAHSIERTYLALVRGQAQEGRIESNLVADRGDSRRGSDPNQPGQLAVTHVRVLEKMPGFTLVECRLETGRTHQVRIHLGEQGTPLCGERVYDRPLKGRPSPDTSGADRPMLHAATLGFDHPVTKKRLKFECAPPDEMRNLRKHLGEPSRVSGRS